MQACIERRKKGKYVSCRNASRPCIVTCIVIPITASFFQSGKSETELLHVFWTTLAMISYSAESFWLWPTYSTESFSNLRRLFWFGLGGRKTSTLESSDQIKFSNWRLLTLKAGHVHATAFQHQISAPVTVWMQPLLTQNFIYYIMAEINAARWLVDCRSGKSHLAHSRKSSCPLKKFILPARENTVQINETKTSGNTFPRLATSWLKLFLRALSPSRSLGSSSSPRTILYRFYRLPCTTFTLCNLSIMRVDLWQVYTFPVQTSHSVNKSLI